MFIDTNWQPYRRLSGGQRLYADLYLLIKIIDMIGGIGFIFLDETLKYADPKTTKLMISLLETAYIDKTLLIYHGNSIEDMDCKKLNVKRISGSSFYEIN